MGKKQPKIICESKFKTEDEVQRKAALNEKLAKLICRAENQSSPRLWK